METCSWCGYCLTLVQTLVLQPHQCLSPHILIELLNGVEQVLDHRVIYFVLEANIKTQNKPVFMKRILLNHCVCVSVMSNAEQTSQRLRGKQHSRLSLLYKLSFIYSVAWWKHLTLHMGHNMKPNVIRGPSQRFSRTRRVH